MRQRVTMRLILFRNSVCCNDSKHRFGGVRCRSTASSKQLVVLMAAPLPGGGSLVFSGSCDRYAALRHQSDQTRSRSSVADPALRLRVRPSSVSCQTCTASSTPGDSHRSSAPSSCQFRAGPSGNSSANRDINGGCDISNPFSGDASQPQQSSDGQSEGGMPAVGTEPVGIVVICGWLGSNKRYLQRYQDWWTQNGYVHKLPGTWLPQMYPMLIGACCAAAGSLLCL